MYTSAESSKKPSSLRSREKLLSRTRLSRSKDGGESERAESTARSAAMDVLAQEWLDNEGALDADVQLYLADTLLPSLILSLEKLLTRVSERGLVDEEEIVPDFNPINYLAQQLMRLNPRPFTCGGLRVHPANTAGLGYAQSLHEVVAQLREKRVLVEQTARLKQQLLQDQLDREKEEFCQKMEEERRCKVLLEMGLVWGEEIPALQVIHVVRSWLEEMDCHPQAAALKARFQDLLTRSISRITMWTDQDLMEALSPGCIDLPLDVFTLFANHLRACGKERQRAQQREQRRSILKEAFMACNPGNDSTLDRQHLLQLFTLYYEHAPTEMKTSLTSPYSWPASGLTEDSKEEEMEWKAKSNEVNEEDYREFLSSPFTRSLEALEEKLPHDQTQNGVADRPSTLLEKERTEESDGERHSQESNNGSPVMINASSHQAMEEKVTVTEEDAVQHPQQQQPPLEGEGVLKDAEKVLEQAAEASLPMTTTKQSKEEPVMPEEQNVSEERSAFCGGAGGGRDSSVGWSPKHVTLPQFLQLCDLFIGDHPDSNIVTSLATFLIENYVPGGCHDADSRSGLQDKYHWRQHCQQKLSAVFSQWDFNFSGFVNGQELQKVLSQWEGGGFQNDFSAVESALAGVSVDNRISKEKFVSVLTDVCQSMSGDDFRSFIDFLLASIQLSQEEKQRGQLRVELLAAIEKAGQRTTYNIAPVLAAAGNAVLQDAIEFGSGKRLSVCVAMLGRVTGSEGHCLHYQFATDDLSFRVMGRKLSRKTVPVSFSAVDLSQTVHIPSVHKCKNIHFFIPEHRDETEYQGELVVVPIIMPPGMVVGVISVDNVASIGKNNPSLTSSEMAFYQGVAHCLGDVFLVTSARRKLIAASEAGIMWLQRRCPYLIHTDFYITKPPQQDETGCVLQRCLSADRVPSAKIVHCYDELRREDNLFREYLFDCAENRESVSADAYCHPHLACPIRDPHGNAVAILDFTLSTQASQIPLQHSRDMAKMVKLLTTAFCQISHTRVAKEDKVIAMALDEGEGSVGVLFHQLLLADLQHSMAKLNNRAFAELRSYTDPPLVVQQTVQALVLTLYPQLAITNGQQQQPWNTCRQYITLELLRALEGYCPTSQDHPHPCLEQIRSRLEGISPSEVFHQGSLPTYYLFTWVSAACAVLEHISIMSDQSLTADTTIS